MGKFVGVEIEILNFKTELKGIFGKNGKVFSGLGS